VGTVSTRMNYHRKGTHRTVENKSQELISTNEVDYNVIVKSSCNCSANADVNLFWRIGDKTVMPQRYKFQ
jgi:hypothetical protein